MEVWPAVGNGLVVTVLITFINTVYARPWDQDERALLLPGIVGGVIGYAIGTQIREKVGLYWTAITVGAVFSIALSLLYNEVLLRLPMKTGEYMYEIYLYMCFAFMNLAAFSVFGVIGWSFGADDGNGNTQR